jgi:hypothetical protein
MTTLRASTLTDFSADERATLERVARRLGMPVDALLQPSIFGVQTHWPQWLEANVEHSFATYLRPGVLPPVAKEAMHAAVSMTNRCQY